MFSPRTIVRRYIAANAYLQDGLCYMEDDILVYNLYIPHVPKDMNETDIEEFFSKYGKVSSVNIQVKKGTNQSEFISGFIHFENAGSAAKVLECSDLRMLVKPADSSLQPKCKDQDNEYSSSKEVDIEENLILKLNDDCLLHIFSFLSFKEQIELSTLCERFNIIFGMQMRKRKSLHISDMKERLTLMEVEELVTQYGDYIEEVKLERQRIHRRFKSIPYSSFLPFIILSCRYLCRLKIFNISDIHLDIYSKLSINLKHLTKLELISCEINDEICNYLSQLPMLDYLDLSGNYYLKGKYLSNFQKLTQLSLDRCLNIEPEYFSNLCKKGLLKSLNIQGCSKLNKKNFEEMESNLDDLTDLLIGTAYSTYDLYNIAGLKNFTQLSIYNDTNDNNIDNKLFELLAAKENTLEELILASVVLNKIQKEYICSIKSLKRLAISRNTLDNNLLRKIPNLPNLICLSLINCDLVLLKGIRSFFEKSNNIRNIDISYCYNIEINTLHYICKKFKESKRSTPCTLYVDGTDVSECIAQNDKYLKSVPLLSIKFQISELTDKFLNWDQQFIR